jgi:hypothetical protein
LAGVAVADWVDAGRELSVGCMGAYDTIETAIGEEFTHL